MKISDKKDFVCEPCILGKQTQTMNREPSIRATNPLEFVSTDVCGPIEPSSSHGFRYVILFIDNFSGYTFIYLMKQKSDAAKALQIFLSDVSPIGKVHNLLNLVPESVVNTLRSDNGGEYMGDQFKSILIDNQIKHEQSAPYSPHQNGIAERGWRTLFEVGRSLLIESNLPKSMWPYAIMAASHVRNRCFQRRTQQTPYFLLTGRKPDLSKLHVFGTVCYTYARSKGKLDNRSKRGVFVGYDRESPSYLVYHDDTKRVQRSRCVKFTDLFSLPNPGMNVPFDLSDDFQNPVPPPINDIQFNPIEVNEPDNAADESIDHVDENIGAPRYERRERRKPQHLDDYVCSNFDMCFNVSNILIPSTYAEAMQSPESPQWNQAMNNEMDSLKINNTYDLVPLPQGKKTVGGRWVFSVKDDPNGSEMFKARFVAKGYNEVKGIDYFDTFSPTAKMTSIRSFIQIAVEYGLHIHQMDVKTAFLNAPIDCDIFIQQPEGYDISGDDGTTLVCKLKPSLYGLKQSGRNWNNTLHQFLIENSFVRSSVDPCVYFRKSDTNLVVIIIWVDDLILGASDNEVIEEIKALLKSRFQMKDLGLIKYFLGIQFIHDKGTITLTQSHYLSKLLKRLGMMECKPRATPCEIKPENANTPTDFQPTMNYREIVGSLIYLMTCTRPDISWAVTRLSQSLENPGTAEWVMLKHVLRYLRGSLDNGLLYQKSEEGLTLTGFSDSDWASSEDRRSTTGYYYSLNPEGPPISWRSCKQPTVALSCEAEYMAYVSCVQVACFLQMLLSELIIIPKPITVYGDNQGAIALVKNPIIHNRSKHIDVKYHFIREKYNTGFVNVVYIPTDKNVADLFMKPATKNKLSLF